MTTLISVTVQSDWVEVISDVLRGTVASESFWVSCYRKGSASVHGSVQVKKSLVESHSVELTGKDGIVVEKITNYSFYVSCEKLAIMKTIIKGTKATFKTHNSAIKSMDISPGGGLFVTGDNEGLLKVGDTSDGSVRRELKGHVADITTCRFFPSGQVVLSGASDFQLRIWSALDGSNPVTLKGHNKGVTDSAIIDRGRNVLSSARDGTVRLWECGSASIIRTIGNYTCAVNKISLGLFPSESIIERKPDNEIDSREVATDDKLVICVLEDGNIKGIDLMSKEEAFTTKSYRNVPLHSCAYSPKHNLVAVGSAEGVIEVFDIRNIKDLFAIQRNDSTIYDLVFIEETGDLLIGQGDGSAFQIPTVLTSNISQASQEFIGFDMDPIYSIREINNGKFIYAAGRDGSLRRF
ncbi:proteasomal ATPase-associated factor 1-like [Rhizophagus clarus]|uniref:Proteasomal ATPase-associated factor 1-like n=1 Tax=Rhizophagus clarus TaxID=94130 RepID=A0A8H3LYG0_9GLOM|nr:proteasomal ATPase-associated factor 1-like [Rhizophagus clarus]